VIAEAYVYGFPAACLVLVVVGTVRKIRREGWNPLRWKYPEDWGD
jgi:hypothetical protein